jgi:UDP-2-acetamido-3-amino-2,3-dideoxy-glucuronate N-acetyltransferase
MNIENYPHREVSQYLYQIETHVSEQGALGVLDFASEELPFLPQRLFYIYGASQTATRGKHAHKKCKQFFIQLSGSCKITVLNKAGRGSIILNDPSVGFLAEELTWCEISEFSEESVLVVLASLPYDADDYISDSVLFANQIGI